MTATLTKSYHAACAALDAFNALRALAKQQGILTHELDMEFASGLNGRISDYGNNTEFSRQSDG